MRRLLIVLGSLAAVALLWTLAVGWWLPVWLLPRLQEEGGKALGEPVRIQALSISPWRLQARIEGVSLGPEAQPWLTVGRLVADVSIESAWRLAPVIERLEVVEPKVFIERQTPDRFNISALVERLRAQPASTGEPQRFALHNIRLSGGAITFADRVVRREHRIEALGIGIPFLSNLPSDVAVYVEPSLDATLDGSPLQITGRSLPFDQGQGSEIAIRWRDVDLAHWARALAPLLPPTARLDVREGRLDLALDISFERPARGASPRLQVRGQAAVQGAAFNWQAGGIDARWNSLAVQGIDVQPLLRQAAIGQVSLQALGVKLAPAEVAAAPAGAPAEAGASVPPPPASGAGTATAPPAGWRWSVGQVGITGRELDLAAWSPARQIQSWSLQATGLTNRPDAPEASLALEATEQAGEGRLSVKGTLAVAQQQARLALDARQWPLARWLEPWQAELPVAVHEATLAARATIEASPKALALRGAELDLLRTRIGPAVEGAAIAPQAGRRSSVAPAAPDRLGWAALRLRGGEVALDLSGQVPLRVEIASAEIDRLDAAVQRLPDGGLAWVPPGSPPLPAPASSREAAAPATGPSSAPVARLAELRCTACQVRLLDRSVAPAADLALTRTDLRLRNLSADLSQRVAFELRGDVQGGRLALNGSARPQPLDVASRIEATGLDLRALQPYIDPYVNLVLASGKASATGELKLARAGEGPPAVHWRGSAGLADLRTLDKLTDAEFVRWRALRLDALDVAWREGDLQADLGSIALDDFYGRVIVNADGHLNLSDIVRHDATQAPRSLTEPTAPGAAAAPAASAASAASAAAPATAPAAGGTPPARLRWSRISLTGGRVDFTDNLIRPNYSARMTGLQGTVSGVAWNDPQPANVQLTGLVDGNAPLRIEGRFHPLGPRLYTDIKGEAKGIELTRLSPYAARYAGYAIEKGTLSMTVHYQLDQGKLDAQNQIFLDQLTFGQAVDSPDAIKAPVLLAVALLKNGKGEIDVNLPITGSIDDPQFSVGGIVVKLIVNLIVKAVTSPFALLASAMGAPDAELGHVAFAPGSNDLDDAVRKKLDTLAQALADRPALKLEVTGRADPSADAEGLRQSYLRRLLRAAKARATGEMPANLAIAPEERDRWLEAAYKAADLPDKPRNALGLARSLRRPRWKPGCWPVRPWAPSSSPPWPTSAPTASRATWWASWHPSA